MASTAAVRMGRRRLVQVFPVTDWATYALAMATLGLRAGDLLAIGASRGRSPPRVRRRGDAGALSDLQLQGLQVQSGTAAARHAALVVLAYLDAFEKRKHQSGVWLGLAGRWR
jgi:hypothetical protein